MTTVIISSHKTRAKEKFSENATVRRVVRWWNHRSASSEIALRAITKMTQMPQTGTRANEETYVRIAAKTQVRIKNDELHRQREQNSSRLYDRRYGNMLWMCAVRIRRRGATNAEDECVAVCVCRIKRQQSGGDPSVLQQMFQFGIIQHLTRCYCRTLYTNSCDKKL